MSRSEQSLVRQSISLKPARDPYSGMGVNVVSVTLQ